MHAQDQKSLAGLLLALAVGLALAWGELASIFAPLLLPALFMVMVFSLMPFARFDRQTLARLHPAVLALVAWQQFVLPMVLAALGLVFDVDRQILTFVLVTVTSGSLFASPTLAQLMGLDQRLAVQAVVLSTLAVPLSVLLTFELIEPNAITLDLAPFANRLAIFLVLPIFIFLVLHAIVRRLSAETQDRFDTLGRWGSVTALIVFCLALEDQVTTAISVAPEKVVSYLAIAIASSVGIALFTRLILARYGSTVATTAMVLASFRNVGLTFGLLGPVAGPDLVVYVGVCQIPMFLSPLLFDIFASGRTASTGQEPVQSPDRRPVTRIDASPGLRRHDPPLAAPPPRQAGLGGALPQGALGVVAVRSGSNLVYGQSLTQSESIALEEPVDERDAMETLVGRLQVQHDEMRDLSAQLHRKVAEHRSAQLHVFAVFALIVLGAAAIWQGNKLFAPMLFNDELLSDVAETHVKGRNFAVFDLNINIRDLRNETIARLNRTPEVVVLGASHWQEAHVELMPGRDFYNSHVHRDYYEDMMAVTEMWVRHGRLPPEMIITIRDNLLTPIAERTDFLWLPGAKYYLDFAERIGYPAHSLYELLPTNTWKELLSVDLLWQHASRDLTAPMRPHATDEMSYATLDMLLPGGSIIWSDEHRQMFDQVRARHEALAFAEHRRNDPPKIDPKGVAHMEALFDYLTSRGVKVTLAHPQFNPLFWDAVQGSPYMDGLRRVEALTRLWSDKYGFPIIGGFAPDSVGCSADMYIDAEHGNPTCLGRLLAQYRTPSNNIAAISGTAE